MAARADFAGVFLVLPAGLNLAMNLYCTVRRVRKIQKHRSLMLAIRKEWSAYRTVTVRESVPSPIISRFPKEFS